MKIIFIVFGVINVIYAVYVVQSGSLFALHFMIGFISFITAAFLK